MRSTLKSPALSPGRTPAAGDRVCFAKAVLVNSSILPVLLQALGLQLPLALQVAVQVAVASVILRSTPGYCASLAADGVQPQQFRWLATGQVQLASLVMAATSSSRGSPHPSEVPCSVSLAHIILVFEVIVPILFVYVHDRSVSCLAARPAADSSDGGTLGGGGSSADGSSRSLAAAPAVVADRAGMVAAARPHGGPPVAVVVFFGLGLAGVLFDVLCTMHTRTGLFG
ncbi:hypothetical protein ABPG75_010481 [Micractinium tetrahymenae]